MFGMSNEQLLLILRDVMKIGGTILLALGIGTAGQIESWMTNVSTVVGAILPIVAMIWSHFGKTQAGLVASAAAAVPEVLIQVPVHAPSSVLAVARDSSVNNVVPASNAQMRAAGAA